MRVNRCLQCSFRKNTLVGVYEEYPEKETVIQPLIHRLVDLMEVFTKGLYYHTAMGNSLTLKSVLAAISPNDNHTQLTINNGMNAGAAFFRLQWETDPEKIQVIRKALRNIVPWIPMPCTGYLNTFASWQ